MVAATSDSAHPTSERTCTLCGRPIDPERLEVLPDTKFCVDCARTQPAPRIDIENLDISQASPITKNGFGPKD
jgi:hypothetical protein